MASTQSPRCAVVVGPYLAGKTTLLEALLHASGSIPKRGSVKDGTSGNVNTFTATNFDQLPAPGALALLGVAGFASRRRRA